MVSGAIGERIAAHRRRRGISQAALAGLVGRSESWLSQVERGIRSVDSLPVILDLARVLRVAPEKLIGRPWQYAPNGDLGVDGLEDVRGFFTRYDDLLMSEPPGTIDLEGLRSSIAQAHRTYQAARYQDVIGQLPVMLAGADGAVRSAEGRQDTEIALIHLGLCRRREAADEGGSHGSGHAGRRSGRDQGD